MPRHHLLSGDSDIPSGEGRAFVVDGVRLAVFHTKQGHLFATAADCPHRNGPLADGLVGNNVVVCPLHERLFDLRTGLAADGSCHVAVYPVVRTDEGRIEVQLPD
jgi:nitrite reductase (NADH) small subunit